MTNTTITPERLAYLTELAATYGADLAELINPPVRACPSCGMSTGSGCAQCRPDYYLGG